MKVRPESPVVCALAELVGFLRPQRCALCGRYVTPTQLPPSPVCPDCNRLVPRNGITGHGTCKTCSTPLISEQDVCTRCRAREFAFTRNYSVYHYTGAARVLIRRFKFEGVKAPARLFAADLAAAYWRYFANAAVVPVPSRRSTVRKRGWGAVEAVAAVLAARHGIPVQRLLKRNAGRSQKTLDYEERLRNLSGAVALRRGARFPDVTLPERVVLLDDIFTTGATAHECADVLQRAGAERVDVLTIAIDL